MKKKVMSFVLGVAVLTGSTVIAQRPSPQTTPKAVTYEQKVELASKAAGRMCADAIDAQRKWLSSHGDSANFKNLAGAMISWEEKFAQGNDFFGSNDNTQSRVVAAFRHYIMDDTKIHEQLASGISDLQQKLLADTYLLFRESGRNLSEFPEDAPNFTLKKGVFQGRFDRLFGRSAQLARSDWFRELTVAAGTYAAGSLTRQLAEESGFVTPDSWSALFVELAADAVAQAAIDEIHDPAGEIGKRLKADYDIVCRQIISGSTGFEQICKYITDQHLQFRANLLGLNRKGEKQ